MGWNSWDSYGTTLTEDELLANARFMAERSEKRRLGYAGHRHRLVRPDRTRAHGYNDNAPLILDEYGRQPPRPGAFPEVLPAAR